MPYDSSLDELIFTKSFENDATRINVSVYSYNNGPKKVQVTRENKDAQGNYRFGKLGRMTKEEAVAVDPLLKEAIGQM